MDTGKIASCNNISWTITPAMTNLSERCLPIVKSWQTGRQDRAPGSIISPVTTVLHWLQYTALLHQSRLFGWSTTNAISDILAIEPWGGEAKGLQDPQIEVLPQACSSQIDHRSKEHSNQQQTAYGSHSFQWWWVCIYMAGQGYSCQHQYF